MLYAWCRKRYQPSPQYYNGEQIHQPEQLSDVWKTIHPQYGGFMDPWGPTLFGGHAVGGEIAIGAVGQLFCLHESGELLKTG